ncbi:group II intron reverse transcriptase/maturase [Salmonella enterica]|nr:group II intron reverse transcriptase/maturase [Salmonella enterica]EJC8747665.1 group II intron reverse transcriptase/maturase [Salmonella enterica]ELU2496187.1 group II intron reverse transcriptase/maturase [Salmonella enterica]EMD8376394.1 group II intron reverse transcriptase/maturase [Salmonella enterica]HCM1648725.1 group II intron reverse transcriptase/maturase [Salmonella enterica subsp. diarizonae serovar 48:i:z35]
MTQQASNQCGAPSASSLWSSINWQQVEDDVFRFQMRIAKATKAQRWNKVRVLQRLLTRSHQAKLLAVRRVTSNRGRNTPGIDGTRWINPQQKWHAAMSLSCRGYRAQPLRRIHIPKKNGKTRPLGIPTMHDRAMQALFLLATEPVTESTADRHSYGFRPKRSAADAIERCFVVLAQRSSAQWILEGDIKGCFDNISHDWMLRHLCIERKILAQWLKAGFLEKGQLFSTVAGTLQGGIISPGLANGVLDGMESMLKSMTRPADKVHMVRYADDFVITGSSKELLENRIKPAVTIFLRERGLTLSEEKTAIVSISQGFDFLGFSIRKYGRKLLIKPAKSSIKSFLDVIRKEIKAGVTLPTAALIGLLNRKITGWVNYYRHVVAKAVFSKIDTAIFWALYRMIRRKHGKKSKRWLYRKYYGNRGLRRWIFHAIWRTKNGEVRNISLKRASATPIRRHRQIRSAANPYDVEYVDYFKERMRKYPPQQEVAGSGIYLAL